MDRFDNLHVTVNATVELRVIEGRSLKNCVVHVESTTLSHTPSILFRCNEEGQHLVCVSLFHATRRVQHSPCSRFSYFRATLLVHDSFISDEGSFAFVTTG